MMTTDEREVRPRWREGGDKHRSTLRSMLLRGLKLFGDEKLTDDKLVDFEPLDTSATNH